MLGSELRAYHYKGPVLYNTPGLLVSCEVGTFQTHVFSVVFVAVGDYGIALKPGEKKRWTS